MTDWLADEPLTWHKHWRDEAGVDWSRRNGAVSVTRLRRLFRDPDATVLHQHGDRVRMVDPVERPRLLARVEPFLAGSPERPYGDQTDFWAAEFKSPDHRSLLVVVESC